MMDGGTLFVWWMEAHSEHRFPAPSSKEGCRKQVLGVWDGGCQGQTAVIRVNGSTVWLILVTILRPPPRLYVM